MRRSEFRARRVGSWDQVNRAERCEVEREEGCVEVRAMAWRREGFCWDIRQP